MKQEPTSSTCKVCEGTIIRVTGRVYVGMGSPIIGPGGKNQWADAESFHCGNCGIKYEFLPKTEEDGNDDSSETRPG